MYIPMPGSIPGSMGGMPIPAIMPGYMNGSIPLEAAADNSAMLPTPGGSPALAAANGFCIICAIIELESDEPRLLLDRELDKLLPVSDDFSATHTFVTS